LSFSTQILRAIFIFYFLICALKTFVNETFKITLTTF